MLLTGLSHSCEKNCVGVKCPEASVLKFNRLHLVTNQLIGTFVLPSLKIIINIEGHDTEHVLSLSWYNWFYMKRNYCYFLINMFSFDFIKTEPPVTIKVPRQKKNHNIEDLESGTSYMAWLKSVSRSGKISSTSKVVCHAVLAPCKWHNLYSYSGTSL